MLACARQGPTHEIVVKADRNSCAATPSRGYLCKFVGYLCVLLFKL